ncbi:MAG: Molybdenum transport ATP-binding protein ModC [Myxococcaceae bacterium]|nr:Molybdenum transport ATP-binding protein ModC [Myxococcaceae bacterium]
MTSETLKVRLSGRVFAHFQLELDFEVPPGITVLFGPSGAGKSTALSAIAGLRAVERGRVTLGQIPWFDSEARLELPVHQRKVAYLFQSRALFPHLTALQNVTFGLHGSPDAQARARKMLERMRVAHLASRKPATFSGGEAQRVALARAFAPGPKLVLLDEPFTALDRPLRTELYAEVTALIAEAGAPALLVTHDPDEARALGTRFIGLDAGRSGPAALT